MSFHNYSDQSDIYKLEENYDLEFQEMMKTLQLSKTIRTLAIIDIVFTLFYLFYDTYLLIPLLLAWTGYLGAKNYSLCHSRVYLVYNIINCFLRLGLSIWFFIYVRQQNQIIYYNPTLLQLIFSSIFFLVSIYIIRFIYIFCNRIKKHTESELLRLRTGDFNVTYIVW